MWILVIIIAGVILWHFMPKPAAERAAPTFRGRVDERDLESPAEAAFLAAAIKAFELRPDGRSFANSEMRLDLQVEQGRYRADFLANEWLVIEIDGAAYHSSPKAIIRDKARDAYFERLGYTVLRIPAKLVFQAPAVAIMRVQEALSKGRKALPNPETRTGWERLAETGQEAASKIKSLPVTVARLDSYVERIAAINHALEPARAAFKNEKMMISQAIRSAKTDLEIEALFSSDPVGKRNFDDAIREFSRILDSSDDEPVPENVFKEFPKSVPSYHNPEIDAEMKRLFFDLREEREIFLREQGEIIRDQNIEETVRLRLIEFGCEKYGEALLTEL